MTRVLGTFPLAVVAVLVSVLPAGAQGGSLLGRVTRADRGGAIAGAVVSLETNGMGAAQATTRSDGSYRLAGITPGSYRVRVRSLGYGPREFPNTVISSGAAVTVDAVLTPAPIRLQEISVTTVSRVEEKQTTAPAAVFAQLREEIAERPALTVADHLKTIPGADVVQGGLVQSNVVARGFNNIFSGALLTLIDNRYAAVPSLAVNAATLFPTTSEDIEKLEFVLGPGAALYGPNAANGVLNIITRSPFTSTGTTLTLEGGMRAGSTSRACGTDPRCQRPSFTRLDGAHGLWRVTARHAMRLGSRVAFKLSGSYLKGTEWQARDTAEPANLAVLTPGLKLPADRCIATTGCRDFNLEQYGGEARVDFRPDRNSEIIGSYGFTNASYIEYTGVGAAQARDWRYSAAQLRARRKRLFIQGFLNFSDAGRSFRLRNGTPVRDDSRVWSAQFQHGLDLFPGRTTLLYGGDYSYTDPRTGGTVNGSNERDDGVEQVGGYLHSVTRLTPKLDFVAAIRLDKHSRLESAVWSPRAALVFKPSEQQAFRVSLNRAFSTPSNTDLFLDLVAEQIPLGGGLRYDIRALGVPKGGFRFRVDGGCLGGTGAGLCMRTPFQPLLPPGTPELLPANAALLWQVAVGAVCETAGQQLCQLMQNNVPASQVGTQLRLLNPTTKQFIDIADPVDQVRDIARLEPTINHQIELGYKALVGGRFQISADAWYEHKRNFTGPLLVESPSVFLDRATTIAYLAELFAEHGVPDAAATAAAIGTGMAGLSGATSVATTGVPLATVVPTNSPLTARSDIFLTSRNFGEVDLWGADLALDLVMGSHLTLAGGYSFVNKDFFSKTEIDGPTDLALNASRSKGSLTVAWRDDLTGWSAETRFRAVKGFPVNSGVYRSDTDPDEPTRLLPTDSYGVLDIQGTWKPPIGARNMLVSLNLQNVFNKHYSTFVGVPILGRLLLSKVSYTF
jgi:outer membrane receptor for ferrienterochelin and colicins